MVKQGLVNLDFADVRSIMRDMGKAMMGTGEATGERRAIMAAEAAIANPLLDEVSMKGARGLLISITGGNDLTLYEVDEAASRIRQEVDEDANIIMGATFDESLDGIVRVSVVATGIDQPADINDIGAEARIAEVAQRLRAQAAARPEAGTRQYIPQPAHAVVVEAPAMPAAPAYELHPAQEYAVAPQAAQPVLPLMPVQAAPQQAPAPLASNEVKLQPMQPRPVTYAEPQPAPRPVVDYAPPGHFIPPVAEQPIRATRMPTVDELPLPAQREWRQYQDPTVAEADAADTKRRTLLDRLTAFGKSRAEEPQMRAAPAVQPAYPVAAQRPAGPQPNAVHAEYAKRPQQVARQQAPLDNHGRIAPVSRQSEDDQLEIPAFLRRQSN
jgi:cell division protein FtsZ